MTPERWQYIERLYFAALERDTGERAAFLAEACAGDDALRGEVESLLRCDARYVEGETLRRRMASATQRRIRLSEALEINHR